MKVSPQDPFQIIYSIYFHEYLGYLFESYVVQMNSVGKLTLQHQNISSKNASEFSSGLDETDFELIRLMDQMQQDAIARKFSGKNGKVQDFFLKAYDSLKGDKLLQQAIENYIEGLKSKVLEKLKGKQVFETGTDGEPTYRRLTMAGNPASILFHFMRNETNTHYFPTIKYDGHKVEFAARGAAVICNHPAWLLCDGYLYFFDNEVDGQKLKPFLKKRFVEVPRKMEEDYYRKFVAQIIAGFDVHAKGFTIRSEQHQPRAILSFSTYTSALGVQKKLFATVGNEPAQEPVQTEEEGGVVFELQFGYGAFMFSSNTLTPSYVKMIHEEDEYTFIKIKRDTDWEKKQLELLRSLGLIIRNGKAMFPLYEGMGWMDQHQEQLLSQGFSLQQNPKDQRRYYLGERSLQVNIMENRDWFDLQVQVSFGAFQVPFLKLREHILQGKREYVLPDGSIALIPEAWFTRYLELLSFSQLQDGQMVLHKHHFGVVRSLEEGELARVVMQRRLEALRDFTQIHDQPLSPRFKGELRPYQKAGYNWMQFLREYKLGGCLADDMGLGKTIQTLALLADVADDQKGKASLLVMPTSLVYNWESEAARFTPSLKVMVYTGAGRNKSTKAFDHYDLVITSYGILRMDIDLLKSYAFHYVILDESQAIKNPSSGIAQAVRHLHADHRLILTGTPLENSVLDIWSQMNFINPGLLGGNSFFKKHFQQPIEKRNDTETLGRLQQLIKPFILRRHKSQVASELPEKIENITYCTMTAEQEEAYEKSKAYYRNQIMDRIATRGLKNSQIFLLQGLSVLRQMANHPAMVDQDYTGASGKMEDTLYKIESIIQNDHKILVFSQYVKHLRLIRNQLDQKEIPYLYLDGQTRDRMELVQDFQKRKGACVFLMSLKAGGVGLNLTAAEYVFIMDPWWNPATETQAIDRAHRIGQDKTVMSYKMISKGTIEEKILNLQQSKLRLARDLITTEDSFVKALTVEDIEQLLG
jgi:superfamily II DNA or RNA helicase